MRVSLSFISIINQKEEISRPVNSFVAFCLECKEVIEVAMVQWTKYSGKNNSRIQTFTQVKLQTY